MPPSYLRDFGLVLIATIIYYVRYFNEEAGFGPTLPESIKDLLYPDHFVSIFLGDILKENNGHL